MGILDEAIKEHLELKRQHGAGDSELRQLEDEAFGAAERPGDEEAASGAPSEAPTAFMAQPDLGAEGTDEAGAPEAADSAPEAEAPSRRRTEIADLQEDPRPRQEVAQESEAQEPAEEEAPAMEHEAIPEPEVRADPSTEERQAIAEQPTEMFDVEEELGAETAVPAGDELVGEDEEEEDDEDDDFWDEKRLSDELDQALDAPFESEAESGSEDEDDSEEGGTVAEAGGESSPGRDEDVLEETPDFLEEAPEDDRLWFEQKPPKDFDFDD